MSSVIVRCALSVICGKRNRCIRNVAAQHRELFPHEAVRVVHSTAAAVQYCTAPVPHPSVTSQPMLEHILKTFHRGHYYRPVDSLISALTNTKAEERAGKTAELWKAVYWVCRGREVTEQHLQDLWTLITKHGGADTNSAVQCLHLYKCARVAPPTQLMDVARGSPEGSAALARCLAACGDVTAALAEADRIRTGGESVPTQVEHALIVAYGRAGDVESALDMAQALLASAEPSAAADLEFIVLLAQLASRRLRPLEALVSRRFHGGGALSLDQCCRLLTVLAETEQHESASMVFPLIPWREYGHRSPPCRLLQRDLVRLQLPQLAVQLLLRALSAGAEQQQLTPLARQLITEMAATGQSVAALSSVCASLASSPTFPRAWYWALEILYRLCRPGEALQAMQQAHQAGVTLREHMFWPALLPACRRQDTHGVRAIVTQMTSSGIRPDHETIRDYILPAYISSSSSPQRSSVIVPQLKDCGLTVAAVAAPIVDTLMRNGHYAEAVVTGEKYLDSISVASLVQTITSALHRGASSVSACVQLLVCAFRRRTPSEDPAGTVLLSLCHACVRNPDGPIPDVLSRLIQELSASEVRVSPLAAEMVQRRLTVSSLPGLELLSSVVDPAVSSQTMENGDGEQTTLSRTASTVDQREDHLRELQKKGGNTRKMLRELIFHYCGAGNIDRAIQLEQEMCECAEPGQQEPLTSGVLSALMAVHVRHGRLEEALRYRHRLQSLSTGTVPIDAFKLIDLATLLVKNGRNDEALSIVRQLPAIDAGKVQMNSWWLLGAAADAADPALTSALLDALVHDRLSSYTVHTLGQVVRAHVVNDDVAAAVDEFVQCVQQHRVAPWSNGLLLAVLKLTDTEKRQNLVETVVKQLCLLHGEEAGRLQLALACAEVGLIEEARTLFANLPSAWERLKTHCRVQVKHGKTDTLRRILKCVPAGDVQARAVLFWALLNAHELSGDVRGVEKLLSLLDREKARGMAKVTSHARHLLRRLRADAPTDRRTQKTAHNAVTTLRGGV